MHKLNYSDCQLYDFSDGIDIEPCFPLEVKAVFSINTQKNVYIINASIILEYTEDTYTM